MSDRKSDFWDYLASVKLAVVLLIILAATSIIGTLIPQNATYDEYIRQYGTAFTGLISALDLFDMYHSWWFVLILALFTLNLIVCSAKRLAPAIDQIKNPKKILTEEFGKSLALADIIKKKGSVEAWKETVKGYLEKKYGSVCEEKIEDRHYLYLEKGKYSRLGVYITHLSIILILIGGLIGAFFGFRGFVNIPEGAVADAVFMRGGKPPYKLDFNVRLDKFSLAYYPNGMVKEYRSDVTIVENGKEVIKDYLIVNRPLSYKNVTFYQSSYGATDRRASVRVFVTAGKNAGKSYEMELEEKLKQIPNSNDAVQINEHHPDLQNSGPAMILHLDEDGEHKTLPVLKNFPSYNANQQGKYFFTYLDYSESYYTGLQATKDPGVWVVWTGCTIMMIGFYYSFFVIRKRIWSRIYQDGDKVIIAIAGHSVRSRIFEEEFAGILEDLKEMKN
jgi:cytochrome c biogenesis protein